MNVHEYEVGLAKDELDTPALLVDVAGVEKNIRTMADFCRNAGIALRPHAKVHKATPVLAWAQLRAGAIGITVAKLSEAEVLASAGIRDILIANQVVGAKKVRRLVNLAAHTNVLTAVDSVENVKEISNAARERGIIVGMLVEVNIGNDRCGVEPMDETLALVEAVIERDAVQFRGLMAYDGHLAFLDDANERHRESRKCYELAAKTRKHVESHGIDVEIVSGGGTATYKAAAEVEGVTELQAGSYIFSDTKYRAHGITEFDRTLSMLATVISIPRRGGDPLAILDLGSKGIDTTYGLPEMRSPKGGQIFSMPQEHSRLRYDDQVVALQAGHTVELWVSDANKTINLHDKIYALRNDVVEAVWEVSGRGNIT